MSKTLLEQLLAASPGLLQETLEALDGPVPSHTRERVRHLLEDLHALEARALAAPDPQDREAYTALVESRLRTIRLTLLEEELLADEAAADQVMGTINDILGQLASLARTLTRAAAAGLGEGLGRGLADSLSDKE